MTNRRSIALVALACASTGCLDRKLDPVAPCVQSGINIVVSQGSSKVDLLFMVDNSNSMTEEQENLAGNFDTMIRALATGDSDGDGVPESPAVRDLHVAVVSSDMGTGAFPVPTCSDDGDPDGDDGVLVTRGNTMVTGCAASYPSFLSFGAGDDVDSLVAQFGCVARLGTGGCGFEQQLEATLKAITPSTSTTVAPFLSGVGHADGRNAGFLREDSILAVVLVTDEEDCSAANPEIFNTSSSVYPGEALNLRCFQYGAESYGAVHPIQRYVDGFLAAVRGDASRLVFAAIAGVPPDAVPNPDAIDYDALLERLVQRVDPADPNRLSTSCNVPGLGLAFPPPRIVRVAQEIDRLTAGPTGHGNTTVQSICEADLRPALRVIARKIGGLIDSACLLRPLAPRVDGTVDCSVRQIVVEGTCASAPGAPPCTTPAEKPGCRTDPSEPGCCLGIDPGTDAPLGQLCTIPQRGVGGAPAGWFYDTSGGDCGGRACTPGDRGYCGHRIAFDDAFVPPSRAIVRLECLQPVVGQRACDAETPCPDATSCIDGYCRSATCGDG